MMACCPEGEGKEAPKELKDEILLKLGKGLGDRGDVVMTRLDDADLKQLTPSLKFGLSRAYQKPQPSSSDKEYRPEGSF